MIVASYNSSDDHGGAAKAAFRLNAALRSQGIEAFLACRHKRTRSKHSIRVTERRSELSPRLKTLERFWMQSGRNLLAGANRTGMSSTIFTLDPFGFDVTEVPLASIARIHHLHWCREFVSPAALKCLRATGRPIFVTLHDQWWMTGGCHYSAGCEKYVKACTDCPQLFSDPAQVAQITLEEKINAFKGANVTVIAPSQWMADCARQSLVFADADVRVVRNPIEIDTFKPLSNADRNDKRDELGFAEGDVVLLFGAQTLADRRKGFTELVEALKRVKLRDDQRLCLVSFGRSAKSALGAIGVPTVELGEITDDHELARIYAAADFFVIPSLEDNYPNTVVESLSCGTPVIGFAAGGIKDLVDGTTTGVLADKVGDVDCLAEAITVGIEKFYGDFEIRDRCREAVEAPHDPQTIAGEMISLYKEKATDFEKPLDEEEISIIQATEQRNSTGRATFAKLDSSSTIFDSESVMNTLLPAFSVFEDSERRIEKVQNNADLTISMAAQYNLGRGQEGVKYLGKGWAAPYLKGAWTNDDRAHLHFLFEDEAKANKITFDLHTRKDEKVLISLYKDQNLCGDFLVEGGLQKRCSFAVPMIAGPGYFNLTLALSVENVEEEEAEPESNPAVFVSSLKFEFEEARAEEENKKSWLDRLLSQRKNSDLALPR